jgi:hypothetical protein
MAGHGDRFALVGLAMGSIGLLLGADGGSCHPNDHANTTIAGDAGVAADGVCSGHVTLESCHTHAECEWLRPELSACDTPILPEPGCFSVSDCTAHDDCKDGRVCVSVVFDACDGPDAVCDACGRRRSLCMPATSVQTLSTCEAVEAAYDRLTSGRFATCQHDTDCHIVYGQCTYGLGGCYEVVNHAMTDAELQTLGIRYAELDCTRGVCDCADYREPARCLDGVCAF